MNKKQLALFVANVSKLNVSQLHEVVKAITGAAEDMGLPVHNLERFEQTLATGLAPVVRQFQKTG